MTQPNVTGSITQGVGLNLALQSAGAAGNAQSFMLVDAVGHIYGTQPTYYVSTVQSANIAAARTTFFDLFNASASGKVLRVWGVWIIPSLTAVTGSGMTWELIRTSAVGTGGTTLTAGKLDTTNAAVPAQVTARTKPTGGATTDATNPLTIFINATSEETISYASMATMINHLPGEDSLIGSMIQTLTVREGEGFKIDQTTNSAVGTTQVAALYTLL